MAGQLGRYKIPRPFKDEDKWFRFFTKRQLIYIGVSAVVSIRIFTWCSNAPFLIRLVTTLFCAVLIIGAFAFGMLKIPEDKYLLGGGITLEKFFLRIIRRRLPQNKVVYVKHYRYHIRPDKDKEKKMPWQ